MLTSTIVGTYLGTNEIKTKGGVKRLRPSLFNLLLDVRSGHQPSAIAPVGHVAAQAPQDTQTSASMLYCESPWEIAPTGQPSAHEPQETQASEITYAIGSILLCG